MADKRVDIQIGYSVNKSSLNEVLSALKKVEAESQKAVSNGGNGVNSNLKNISSEVQKLENILNKSWNDKLNQLDLGKLNKSIKEAYGGVGNLKTMLVSSGTEGAAAYNKLASSILNTNLQLKQSNTFIDKMATSMKNTLTWGVTSSIFHQMTGAIQKAWGYTKELDKSLNNIRIVTGKSADEMQRYARVANESAKALGTSTTHFTDASLIFYQQGRVDFF